MDAESELASVTDLVNTICRENGIEEAKHVYEVRAALERIWFKLTRLTVERDELYAGHERRIQELRLLQQERVVPPRPWLQPGKMPDTFASNEATDRILNEATDRILGKE